jgi:hypothetical protein
MLSPLNLAILIIIKIFYLIEKSKSDLYLHYIGRIYLSIMPTKIRTDNMCDGEHSIIKTFH